MAKTASTDKIGALRVPATAANLGVGLEIATTFNAERVGLLVAALQQGDYSRLRIGTQDGDGRGVEWGVLVLVSGLGAAAASAMQQASAKEGIAARTLVLGLAAEGVQCAKER